MRSDTEPPARSQSALGRIARSFPFAVRGVVQVFRTETNAWVHAVMTVAVVVVGSWVGATALEWCVLILSMSLVWGAECLNTAIESLADAVHPDQHPLIGRAKDAAAGAVLVVSIGSALVGLIVLMPGVLRRLELW